MEEFGCTTLAQRFENAGYRTAAVATNTLLTDIPQTEVPYMPFDIGFQTWHGLTAVDYWKNYMNWTRSNTLLGLIKPNKYLSWPMGHLLNPSARRTYRHHHQEGERTTDSAIAYLQELQNDARPYFLFAQYFDPHTPYAPPDEIRGTLTQHVALPEGYGEDPTSAFNMRVSLREEVHGSDTLRPDLPRGDYLHAIYKEEVAFFDQQLGRLLEAVAATNRPTIIAFTADHGEGFGLHSNVEHGESLYEAEIAVPFLLVAPNLEPRQLDFAPRMLDHARTLLSLAGVETKGFDGVDVLADQVVPQPAMSFMIQRVSMREGDWKLHCKLSYTYDRSNPEAAPQEGEYELVAERLFHLAEDPLETKNLLGTEQEVEKRLLAYIVERLKADALPAIGLRVLSPSERAQLAEIGYAE
jgi:arylsulfatase A-like enzyme